VSLAVTPAQVRLDPVVFADTVLRLNEKGEPWSPSRHQRRALARIFRRSATGRLRFRLVLWSEVKKSGKTFLAAWLLLWWAIITPNTEIIVVANDLEQAVGRVFRTAVALIRHNRWLQAHVTVLATELRFKNGTVVTAIAGDYRGAAGSRHSLYLVDEPWAVTQESAERLIEELTPPPTEVDAWGLWTTTAGILGESQMLQRVYERGLAGERVDDELEVYEADDLAMFWSHTPRQPWQTAAYYAEQRRSLRPSTYARLHENRWVSAESVFITPELWDPCVDEEHHPELPSHDDDPVYIGVDAGVKSDNLGVVEVKREGHVVDAGPASAVAAVADGAA
jgi:phage terminase large subunit-like protein